jgi:hypothetical protein
MTREPRASFLLRVAVWSTPKREETRRLLACSPIMHHRSAHIPSILAMLVCSVACDVIEINHGKSLEARAQTLAEAYCAAYQACDCSPFATDAVHPDPEQCVERERTRLIDAFEQAEEHELEFDSGCMDQLLAHYEQLGCESIADINAEFGHPEWNSNFGCALYHGEVSGGICEGVPGTTWSDCEAGSRCGEQNACEPVMTESTAGEQGDSCGFTHVEFPYDCAMGLYCDQLDGCQPVQGQGEPCSSGGDGSMRCAVDHFCEPLTPDSIDGICQPRLDAGAPCMDSASCDGRCEMGVCIDMPALCLYTSLEPHTNHTPEI